MTNRRLLNPRNLVLLIVCLMYLITYMDRVNIATGAPAMQKELGLSNKEFGLAISAFAYPYAFFQIAGGWLGDFMGARWTLVICGILWSSATVIIGYVEGFASLFAARVLLGFGEGAAFPTATRALAAWTPASQRGWAQGITHSFARLGNAITPPLVAWLMVLFTWRGSFVVLGGVSLLWVIAWVWYFRDEPKDHPAITPDELATLPQRAVAGRVKIPWAPLVRRMWPVTLTYFCYGWCLWLYLNWLPLFFKNSYNLDIKNSAIFASGVFFAGVVGDTLGGVLSDGIYKRTGNLRLARLSITVLGFAGAFLSLMPIFWTRDITTVAICLSLGFFCAELVIGPMWAIPMDIAPKYSGTASGLMNTGSAFAAIVSPLVAGFAGPRGGGADGGGCLRRRCRCTWPGNARSRRARGSRPRQPVSSRGGKRVGS